VAQKKAWGDVSDEESDLEPEQKRQRQLKQLHSVSVGTNEKARDRKTDRREQNQNQKLLPDKRDPVPYKPPFKAYVGNLCYQATAGKIKDFFQSNQSKRCTITNIRIMTEQPSGRSLGFAYVEFAERKSFQNALTYNDVEMRVGGRSRPARVGLAKEKGQTGGDRRSWNPKTLQGDGRGNRGFQKDFRGGIRPYSDGRINNEQNSQVGNKKIHSNPLENATSAKKERTKLDLQKRTSNAEIGKRIERQQIPNVLNPFGNAKPTDASKSSVFLKEKLRILEEKAKKKQKQIKRKNILSVRKRQNRMLIYQKKKNMSSAK